MWCWSMVSLRVVFSPLDELFVERWAAVTEIARELSEQQLFKTGFSSAAAAQRLARSLCSVLFGMT